MSQSFDKTLTTQKFFASANHMGYAGRDWTDLRDSVPFDNINQGVDSLFNHFTTFQYSSNILEKYEPSAHFVGYAYRATSDKLHAAVQEDLNRVIEGNRTTVGNNQKLKDYYNTRYGAAGVNKLRTKASGMAAQQFVTNPTAQTIINWSASTSSSTLLGYQPYAWTDFGFCKYYGKIPNNRLITLRRFPFPIGDRLKTPNGRDLIPLAQAVTWFGSETGNKLSKIGNFQWNMPWFELEVTQQDIAGNEVTIDDLVGIVSGIAGNKGQTIAKALKYAIATVLVKDDPSKIAEVNGTDEQLRDYVKNAYNKDSGPYWNRVYGPVNVIHKSHRRERGMQDQYSAPFNIEFHYQFRSFSGLSPKMVALDLISNFLQLTYNNAQFLGQLSRYFPRPGLKFSPSVTEALTEFMLNWASGRISASEGLTHIKNLFVSMGVTSKNAVDKWMDDLLGGKSEDLLRSAGSTIATGVSVYAAGESRELIPKLISAKSALSDRPVGEWHIVVGNPINPIFVMGDLLVTNCVAQFDEEIGPDDFPTGIKFTVTMKQAKPRDKFAIERMFNQGFTGMGYTKIKTSSEEDTFGTENDERFKVLFGPASQEDRKKAITDAEKQNPGFARTRERIGLAYSYRETDSEGRVTAVNGANVDDSILGLYYKKDFASQ